MRINEFAAIVGEKVVLVPYRYVVILVASTNVLESKPFS